MTNKPLMIFPSHPLRPYREDEQYTQEAEVAKQIGFQVVIVDYDALESGNINKAFKYLDLLISEQSENQISQAVYRGWMLNEVQYEGFYKGLQDRNITLFNDPQAYTMAHHYPMAYQTLMHYMAKSWFIEKENLHDNGYLAYAFDHLAKGPVVIKDWVKSQAYYWDEACFIPDTSDIAHARKVIDRFIELQGSYLVGGIVIREYHDLVPNEEWRAFVVDGQTMGCWPKITGKISPPEDLVEKASELVFSRFASIDFALKADGGWLVIETGDGQVSEFPPSMPKTHIFLSLKEALQMEMDMVKEIKNMI